MALYLKSLDTFQISLFCKLLLHFCQNSVLTGVLFHCKGYMSHITLYVSVFIYLQGYLRKYLQWYDTIIIRWPQQAKILVCFRENKWYLLKVLYVCIHFVILRAHLTQELSHSGLSCNIYWFSMLFLYLFAYDRVFQKC